MTDAFKQQIQAEARQAVEELLEQAKLKKGDVFVVGCLLAFSMKKKKN
jgi:uncharacterized protein YwlG (UPF0340 family)